MACASATNSSSNDSPVITSGITSGAVITIAKDYRTVMLNYRNGINKGLYKIMSKMGISTIASYRCSKLFEAVGLHDDVVGLCFICPYISRHLLSLNPLLACCRRYSRGER